MKLIHFSQIPLLNKYEELADIKSKYDIQTDLNSLSAEELLQCDVDIIELGCGDFSKFKSLMKSLDLKTSRLGVADCLVKVGKELRPQHLTSEAIFKAILEKVPDLKNSESAVVIGDYDFVLSMSYKLAQAGFFKLIISTESLSDNKKIKSLLQTCAFNMQITAVPLSEITQVESGSVLLISNLSRKKNPEAYESITYFNFLARGAAFVDINSRSEPSLAEEARRAEIIVIDELLILRIKYQSILEMFKNSSFV